MSGMQVSIIYYLLSFKNINLVIEKIMLLIPATTSQPLGSLQVPQTCKNIFMVIILKNGLLHVTTC